MESEVCDNSISSDIRGKPQAILELGIKCEECSQIFNSQDGFDEHYFEHYKRRVDAVRI